MRLGKISIRNIRYRALSSFLSVLLLAFGTGIIVLLLTASEQIENQFTKNIKGIDMVVGAKGSPMQLILSGVYHIDAPTGNIPLNEFNKLSKNPLIESAIPLAYGDSYEGYRIIGTEQSYPELYSAKLASGDWWSAEGEVVLGARVAEYKGLKTGDEFYGSHGLGETMDEHDDFPYKVVGVMEPTGTVMDKLILTQVSSVWAVHGHEEDEQGGEEHEHHDHETEDEDREITVGLISFRSPMGNLTIPRMVNQNTSMQAALPAIEVNRLFSLMGTGIKTLRLLAILIVVISAISVFISLYQSLKERKYELALLRTMGASGGQLLLIIILEGLIIAAFGYLCGIVLGKSGLMIMSAMASESYQYNFEIAVLTTRELLLLPIVLGIGLIAALIPALRAYQLNISKVLSDE